jgi:hypothetical protein
MLLRPSKGDAREGAKRLPEATMRTPIHLLPLLLSLMAILPSLAPSPARSEGVRPSIKGKKLIEFGWDEPDTAFMRRHLAEMEATPFDGCVFHVNYAKPGGSGNFTWECWGRRTFTPAELQPALDDLKATRFRRFRHNFLRFNVTPGDVDWFDDFSPILANTELAARVAKQGRCAGLLFDIEQYNAQPFDYRKQRDAKSKSWDEYAAQVRLRGRQVMEAFQKGYPGLKVFLTFGYSLPWAQMQRRGASLADVPYGLLAPLLDGMAAAAKGKTRIVEGCELAYPDRTSEQLAAHDRLMRREVLPIVGEKGRFPAAFSFGFGLWLDYDWRRLGWDENEPAKNYYTPEAFESSVRRALELADEYVWVYTETPRWWSPEGKSLKLPQQYVEAVRRARQEAKQ